MSQGEQGERSSQALGVPQREKKKAKKGRRIRVRSVTVKREGVRRGKRRQKKRSISREDSGAVNVVASTKDKTGASRVKNLRQRKTGFEKETRFQERQKKKKRKKKAKRKVKKKRRGSSYL